MSVDTIAYIPSINRNDVSLFLKMISNFGETEKTTNDDYVAMHFNFQGDDRTLHVHNKNLIVSDKEKLYKKNGWDWNEEDFVNDIMRDNLPINTKGIYLSFGHWGESVRIMKIICFRFGGYLDENDSDTEPYYKVDKNYRKIIPEIFN